MQNHYEPWANEPDAELQVPEPMMLQVDEQSFPFSQELKVLEDSLPLNWEEGVLAYRQHQGLSRVGAENLQSNGVEPGWDELARQVADHVVSFMAEAKGQTELDHWQSRTDALYSDNRIMAEQVQRLVDENDQLRASLSAAELELARHRHLMGNLYLKL